MKKAIVFLICAAMVMSLCSCGGGNKGIIEGAETHEVGSSIYTQEEITSAIDTIKSEFRSDWKGCTLKEIYYAGDEESLGHQEWAERNNADEAIVLISTFDVDSSGGDGSLNANSTYTGWMWILVRTSGGKWQHVDHGY